ncbi:MAG: hypothetical protein GWN31_14920 [Candidatus Thorarchaeota archaeon]|nr:hypothetical protein [Candidatus Thorarchaeota archaeon]NIW15186.1 hypothetical protein [Candidatus Thorarchaeota archaeon]NIW53175.1 hypothetical protein [Candidatus Korarchaeota archaeon]
MKTVVWETEYDRNNVVVEVAYYGSGNPEDEHDIIGVRITDNSTEFRSTHTIGSMKK